VATPNTGVTKVGLVSTTNFVPVPVCEAMDVVLPTLVMTPVKLALVVTLPAVKLAAVPVNPVPAPVNEVAVTVPLTSKAVAGAVVPIPTLAFRIFTKSVAWSSKAICPAAEPKPIQSSSVMVKEVLTVGVVIDGEVEKTMLVVVVPVVPPAEDR